jgi:FlaA1/EpsC-like NDP-sugar epimerase
METVRRAVSKWPRGAKRLVALAFDVGCVLTATVIALAAEPGILPPNPVLERLLLIVLACTIPAFTAFGLYRSVLRAGGTRITYFLGASVIVSCLLLMVIDSAFLRWQIPWTAIFRFGILLLAFTGFGRLVARDLLNRTSSSARSLVIYGAGEAGRRLAEAMAASGTLRLVAFVDDDVRRQGVLMRGVRVESPDELNRLVRHRGVTLVLLAMPNATRRRRSEILESLRPLGVAVQTVPELSDIVSGAALIDDIRDVQIGDLLGRDAIPTSEDLQEACIRGKSVMVTGAGGSIGSELCRQIVSRKPQRLVLVELSEHALYQIDRELRMLAAAAQHPVEIVSLLGTVNSKLRMRKIMRSYGVRTVYHAAAYKHVPIVEENVLEGINNNVLGTWYTAEAAIEAGVETFVLISSDKAVNPPNVMGASKRFAEIVLQGLQHSARQTRFCMVRFGNVLDSSGSVVPLFRDQIRRGGPVTVTHPEVSRYFMTIPEAVNLVLQAGSMGMGGDVLVLEMGKPVRIADLARRMIELSGLTVRDAQHPEGDIEIRFTGLRAAEKLHEELLIGKNVTGTGHPMILRAVEHFPPWDLVQLRLRDLAEAIEAGDVAGARVILEDVVVEYKPANDLADLVWRQNAAAGKSLAAASKVTELSTRRLN